VVQTNWKPERQLLAEERLYRGVLEEVMECDARHRQSGRRDFGLQVPDLESREQKTDLLLVQRVGYGYIDSRRAGYHKESTKDLLLLEMCDDDSHVLCQLYKDMLNLHTKTD
jgi:hypothetical protein